MSEPKIKVKLYSEAKDLNNITFAISKLQTKDYDLIAEGNKEVSADTWTISIVQLDSTESRLFNSIQDLKVSLASKFIFVVPENKALVATAIVKLGFNNIFVLPAETSRFVILLNETIAAFKEKINAEHIENKGQNIFAVPSSSTKFNRIHSLTKKIAKDSSINVLITGETGTGKGLLARTIHRMSTGADAPFVDVLCTTIPEELLESELFGHERGSFTNAQSRKLGLFELAENGTLFLDEIGDLSFNLQSKLLRVIEKKVIRRIGGLYDIPINTRIITATNKNLETLIEQKLFRSDLYYRLNTVTAELPPLRERGRDIILLTQSFIKFFNVRFGKIINRIEKEAEKFLLSYYWPGNIRELRNAIERAVLMAEGKTLKLKHIIITTELISDQFIDIRNDENIITMRLNYRNTNLKMISKTYAEQLLELNKGNKSTTARLLGISRPTLNNILK